jgi:hypothetical protein
MKNIQISSLTLELLFLGNDWSCSESKINKTFDVVLDRNVFKTY